MLSLILANFILSWHMDTYEQRTIKMKITQMNGEAIITYINLTKGKVHIPIEFAFKKRGGGGKSHYTNFKYLTKLKEL